MMIIFHIKIFLKDISKKKDTFFVKKKGWINVYKYFYKSENQIWPRGFPLNKINNPHEKIKYKIKDNFYIQQRLADLNPDVDAIYRLINKKLNIRFKKK